MNIIKFNKLLIFVLLFSTLILLTGCSKEIDNTSENSKEKIDYSKIAAKIKAESESFSDFLKMGDNSYYNEIIDNMKYAKNNSSQFHNATVDSLEVYFEKTKYTNDDISNVFSNKQKVFLVSLYNEISNPTDSFDINNIIVKYKDNLESSDFTKDEYGQLLVQMTILESSIYVVNQIIEEIDKESTTSRGPCSSFNNCFTSSVGRNVGQGMVWGAAVGGIAGGITGAAGGTVVLPVAGTATGAVGGAVFGAADGAWKGALGGVLWTAGGCAGRLNSGCLGGFWDRFWNK